MAVSLVFRSKRSAWFSIAVLLPLLFMVVIAFQDPWYISLVMLPVLILIVPIYFRTFYKIHDINQLSVVCGLFYNKTFPVNEIIGLRPTNNVMSSPALSLDRIELRFRDRKTLLISPVKPDQFIEALLSINPGIEVKKR
jgi:hypothetical protein